jgi:tetrahydromethanopterin S-methyltransferase subunit B
MRDITLGQTHVFADNTAVLGVPTALVGATIGAFPDGSSTAITAGITGPAVVNSVTGSYIVTVVATTGNGYAAGVTYTLRFTAGTLGGQSIIGYVFGGDGQFSIQRWSSGVLPAGTIVSSTFADGALDAVWTTATRRLSDGTNIALVKGVGLLGLNDLSAAEVSTPAQVLTQVNAALDTALVDSIPALGALPSLRQGIYMMAQMLQNATASGLTLTIYKVDGTTVLFTETLNSSTAPTALTRAT